MTLNWDNINFYGCRKLSTILYIYQTNHFLMITRVLVINLMTPIIQRVTVIPHFLPSGLYLPSSPISASKASITSQTSTPISVSIPLTLQEPAVIGHPSFLTPFLFEPQACVIPGCPTSITPLYLCPSHWSSLVTQSFL